MEKEDRYNVRALDRAICILNVLADGKPRNLKELSAQIGLNPSTTFRLLSTLNYHNYVARRSPSGEYVLGGACLELARSYYGGNDLRRVALPVLEELRDSTTETVHLATLDRVEVVWLEKLPGLHAIGVMSSAVGGRAPAHCTAVGKAQLAYVDTSTLLRLYGDKTLTRISDNSICDREQLLEQLVQVRQRGFALDWGEYEPEVRCIAAPVFDPDGRAVAAISVSGPAARMEPLEGRSDLLGKTMDAAAVISARLGHHRTA